MRKDQHEPESRPRRECTSFVIDIRPKFTSEDVQHMNDMVGMDLNDYETVKSNADLILQRLKESSPSRRMPPAPRDPWPPDWIQCFEQWIKNDTLP